MRTITAVFITLVAIASSTLASAEPTADTVLLGGKIVTVNTAFPTM